MEIDRVFLLLATTIAVFGNGNCLDFSQFYLPPCCYISPQGDHFSGYASPSNKLNVNTKREVKTLEDTLLIPSSSQIKSFKGFDIPNKQKFDSNKLSKNLTKKRVYSLVIPLDPVLYKEAATSTTELPETTQIKPPTTGSILLPEIRNRSNGRVSKFKRDSNPVRNKNKLLEVLTSEIEDTDNDHRETPIGKKSLVDENYHDSATLQPEHRTAWDQTDGPYEKWEPKKIRKKAGRTTLKINPKRFKVVVKQDPLLVSANSVKRQAVKKMPPSWLKNLRRAIYQSIAAADKPKGFKEDVPPDNTHTPQPSSKNNILYPETWRSIQSAKIQFVNKMSQVQVASDLNSAIFLPKGQGPVVSGVLVNTNRGGLQLRVASELHSYEGSNDVSPGCHCYLVNNGEILVAYWSVSRVFNEEGQPALQYLVFPLPFSVPTPPEYIPFSSDPNFRPSQVDPLTNYYEQIHRTKQYTKQFPGHNHVDNFNGNLDFIGRNRNPKLFHELPNGQHGLELQGHPLSIPSPIPTVPIQPGQGPLPLGVIIEKDGQYTPEFIQLYQEAVQNHLQQQDEDQKRMSFQGPPFPAHMEINRPVNYQANPPPFPTQLMNTPPEHFVQPRPVLLPGPTDYPVQNDQIAKPPTYPNSIQDIISPFPHANAEFNVNLLDQVPVGQPPLPPQGIPVQYNPAISPQPFLNQELVSNHPQYQQGNLGTDQPYPPANVQSTGGRYPNKIKKINRDKWPGNAYYEDNRKGNSKGDYNQRPYKVSNVLDNEKKYYPHRKPSNNFVKSFSESRSPYTRRIIHDSHNINKNNDRGYILNF